MTSTGMVVLDEVGKDEAARHATPLVPNPTLQMQSDTSSLEDAEKELDGQAAQVEKDEAPTKVE